MKTTKAEFRAHMLKEIMKTVKNVPTRQVLKVFNRSGIPFEERLAKISINKRQAVLLKQHAREWLLTEEALKNPKGYEYLTPEKVEALL